MNELITLIVLFTCLVLLLSSFYGIVPLLIRGGFKEGYVNWVAEELKHEIEAIHAAPPGSYKSLALFIPPPYVLRIYSNRICIYWGDHLMKELWVNANITDRLTLTLLSRICLYKDINGVRING